MTTGLRLRDKKTFVHINQTEDAMECYSLKADQRLESPLDVLSRAASMIQKENSQISDVPQRNDVKERENSSDSGFEDSPNSPTKLHTEKSNSPPKILTSRERRERRVNERRLTNMTVNLGVPDKRKDNKDEDDLYRGLDKNPMKKCGKNCVECNALSYPPSPKSMAYIEQKYAHHYPELVKTDRTDKDDDRHIRASDERNLRSPKYSRIPPPLPPFVPLHPPPFSWFPHPFPSPLSLIRRQSVITSACCPQQYVNSDGVSICPCANPKCNIQAISFGSHIGRQAVGKREVYSAVPPGFELPTVEEHFRKSLGNDYEEEPLNSVDEHFAKALGNTWYNLKCKDAIESQFRTRERALSSCNF